MANAAVYYFSATGNSLYAAKNIAQAIDGKLIAVQNASIIENTYDIIGFVFPTFSWGMPRMMEEFITRLEIMGRPYIFGIATCGVSPGAALVDLERILKWKGQQLAYGQKLVSAENNIFSFNPSQKAIQKGLIKADIALKQLMGEVLAQKECPPRHPVLTPLFRLMHRSSTGKYASSDNAFEVGSQCVGCGLCQSICPAGNIVIEQGRPVFLHQCEHCIACVQWCPQEAINWKGKTNGRARYHHPQVTLEEMQRQPDNIFDENK